MTKSPIKVTPLLRRAVEDMAAAANQQLVGLVFRCNEDDGTLRTMWSEAGNSAAHADNPGVADRGQMFRYLDDDRPNNGVRQVHPERDLAGFHAEELFIACWPALLRDAGLSEDRLARLDMVLSKSPCHGTSASSMLRLGDQRAFLPIGCSSKLASLATAKSMAIEWRIAFLSLAGSDAPDYVPVGGPGVNRLMSQREQELAAAAAHHVHHRDVAQPAQGLQAAHLRARANMLRTNAGNMAAGPIKGQVFQQANRDVRNAAAIDRRSGAQAQQAFNDARLLSIRQAQAGITVLERLPHVDIRRWTG